jgi:hypothetical protein
MHSINEFLTFFFALLYKATISTIHLTSHRDERISRDEQTKNAERDEKITF